MFLTPSFVPTRSPAWAECEGKEKELGVRESYLTGPVWAVFCLECAESELYALWALSKFLIRLLCWVLLLQRAFLGRASLSASLAPSSLSEGVLCDFLGAVSALWPGCFASSGVAPAPAVCVRQTTNALCRWGAGRGAVWRELRGPRRSGTRTLTRCTWSSYSRRAIFMPVDTFSLLFKTIWMGFLWLGNKNSLTDSNWYFLSII